MMSVTPSPNGDVFAGWPLPRRRLSVEAAFVLPYYSKALQWDGQRLWISTLGNDYVRLSADGQVVDAVVVRYGNGFHWTSNALTFDGTLLWGALPGNLISPAGSFEYSEVLAFDAGGRAPDSLRLWERTLGLAHDGSHFWSLRAARPSLVRFDRTGALLDSLPIGIPDPEHLEFDGSRFWTLGYYLARLYELDGSGRVLSICDLPEEESGLGLGLGHGGLAVDGSRLWYAKNHIGYTTVYRMTIQTGGLARASQETFGSIR
jgi:hypothetical protein